jgi:hypothetical protein
VMGETTFDIGPGAKIWIAAGLWLGIVVWVNVGCGGAVLVGLGVDEGIADGVSASATSVPILLAASAVIAITVGTYSGGYAVGTGLDAGAEQLISKTGRRRKKNQDLFMQQDSLTSPTLPFQGCWTCTTRQFVPWISTIRRSHCISSSDNGCTARG